MHADIDREVSPPPSATKNVPRTVYNSEAHKYSYRVLSHLVNDPQWGNETVATIKCKRYFSNLAKSNRPAWNVPSDQVRRLGVSRCKHAWIKKYIYYYLCKHWNTHCYILTAAWKKMKKAGMALNFDAKPQTPLLWHSILSLTMMEQTRVITPTNIPHSKLSTHACVSNEVKEEQRRTNNLVTNQVLHLPFAMHVS